MFTTKVSSSLQTTILILLFIAKIDTRILDKAIQDNKFNDYILLNQGITGYNFLYKPVVSSRPSTNLEGEQYLLIDFENFEIRDKLPYLPTIKISYFDHAPTEEEIRENPKEANSRLLNYYNNKEGQDMWFDEGYYLVPLLSVINGKPVGEYRILVDYPEKSFLQSIKFNIGVYSVQGNTGVGFNARLPFKVSSGSNSVLSFPLSYDNKPTTGGKEDVSKVTTINCGLEVNTCQGVINNLVVYSLKKGEDNPTPVKELELANLEINGTGTFRKFSIDVNTMSLRVESSTTSKGDVYGKIRIICQNVNSSLDLKSIETSKNTILDYSYKEGMEIMQYSRIEVDSSLNISYGRLAFYQDMESAIFMSQCGFSKSIFEDFSKIKNGSLSLSSLNEKDNGSKKDSPQYYIASKQELNFQEIPFGHFSKPAFYTFYKSLLVRQSKAPVSPKVKIYTSNVKEVGKEGALADNQILVFVGLFLFVLVALLLCLRKCGLLKMRRFGDENVNGGDTDRPGSVEFERVRNVGDDWADTRLE